MLHVVAQHGIEEVQRVGDVVLIVFLWVLDGFSDVRIGAKMHDRVDVVFFKDLIETRRIRQIAFFKMPPFHGFAVSVYEVVEYDRVLAELVEVFVHMAADIAGAACDKYHLYRFLSKTKSAGRILHHYTTFFLL